jgi:hypothetical protein
MATVSKEMAHKLAAGNGYYLDDPRVLRIVEYENCFNGAKAYGLEYEGQIGKYSESQHVLNPKVYWQA